MGNPGVAPTRLGRYELLARLATGGMGEIFLARLEGAQGFEKLFVVKRILPHLADDARFRQMLIAEARLASKLTHANICQVYELGETDGQLYIVMEHMEGGTMLSLLRRYSKHEGQLEFGFIGGVIQQTTDALHYAHELKDRDGEPIGIVHRDVTPGNIFLTDAGVAKVLDFGIAKVKDASANTQTGTVKGKYAYMAPEQLRGHSLDRRADVFALGVVLYEMVALRRLFQRKTDYLTFRAVMEQPIPDVRRYRPDIPDALADSIMRALDRDASNRFDTARQFGSAILDGLTAAGIRPWTQGELSDFIRAEFAEEISKRTAQVATAINRTNAGTRSTMPLIAQPDETQIEDEEDDEFPAVDSTVTETPLEIRATRQPQDRTDFTGQVTPPPFSNETSTSGLSIEVLRQVPLAPAQVAAPRRSIVWPLLALAMVGIAGAALFLVWKQMQQQPTTVNITSTQDPDRGTTVDDAGVGAVGSAGSAGSAGPPVPAVDAAAVERPPPAHDAGKRPIKPPPQPKTNPYTLALQGHRPAINKCGVDHGAPPAGARVVISVATSGRPKGVQLEPASLNSTPLGGCIKTVLMAVAFPSASTEQRLTVNLKTN